MAAEVENVETAAQASAETPIVTGPAAAAEQTAATAPVEGSLESVYDWGDVSADSDTGASGGAGAEEATTETVAPPQTPATKETQPSVPAWLLREAQEYGISEGQATALGVESLSLTVGALRQRDQAWRQHVSRQTAQPQQPQQELPQEDNLGLSEEEAADIHPRILDTMRQIKRGYQEEIGRLRQQVDHMTQAESGRQMAEAQRRVNGYFDSSGMAEEFGTGGRENWSSEQMENRRTILAAMDAFSRTFQTLGRNVTEQQLFEMAVRGPLAKAPAKKQAAAEPVVPSAREKAWKEGGVARPTGRKGPLPKGEKAAIENVRRFKAEHPGIFSQEDAEGSEDVINGFLD